MGRSSKISLAILGVILVVALGASAFVPLLERQTHYCFYCGQTSTSYRLLNLPAWRSHIDWNIYEDSVQIPAHSHHMIGLCGYRWRLFRGTDNWDEFGWTGAPCREVLVEVLKVYPDRRDQILQEFLEIVPEDSESRLRFLNTYRIADTELVDSTGAEHGT